jgi:DNA repair protein RecN (Recombination protein N)
MELDAEHTRLAHAQSLIDAARTALDAIAEADVSADALAGKAVDALDAVTGFDARLEGPVEALRGAQAQLQDAAHTLASYLDRTELDPERLRALEERLSAWIGLARRHRRPPAELPSLLAQWKAELKALDAAADLESLQRASDAARTAYDAEARRVSAARKAAAPKLAAAVTRSMQQLGMAGGRFDVALAPTDGPQSFGLESAEFLVAGHAGSTPRPLGKVASGGELSRIALSVAVVTSELDAREETPSTLIFDEVDAGIGGAVAETVGRLMKQLGRDRQVLAVTHLPQVAACADRHFVVAKTTAGEQARSTVSTVAGESRVAEIARMLGGEKLSSTSLAHAQEMLKSSAEERPAPTRSGTRKAAR